MYNWKAEVGDDVLEDSKGASYGEIDQENLNKFSIIDGKEAVGSVNLDTGEIELFGETKVEAGKSADRNLIWIKRNLAQPGKPLKTNYLIGYYEGKKKVCFNVSEDGKVEEQ
jgi:hypothetical protein